MPTYQRNSNILVALKAETTTGVAAGATASTATEMRIIGSPGLELKRAQIQSVEKRDDGNRSMGRLGGKSVDGSYNAEITVGGGTDLFIEGLMRGTWATSTVITFATMTSITTGTNSVVGFGGGASWLTQGIKVGDVFTLSNHSTAANNGKNFDVIAVSTVSITTPLGALTADAVADAAGTLTVLKKLTQPATPTRRTYTVEQYDSDIDLSELFLGCRAVGLQLSYKPGAMATAQYSMMGIDRTVLTTGTSPWFVTPILTTSLSLIADDSAILKDGVAIATFTGFDLNFQVTAAGQPVIGSFTSPDIFDNDLMVSGTLSGLRSDFSNLTSFDAETEFSIAVKLQEPTGSPPACLKVFLPRVKLASLSASVGGGDGAKIETYSVMVAPKVAATGFDGTVATFSSSGA